MRNKWKKTGAALLIAGLTISGTGYALAEGGKVTEAIDLSQLGKDTVEEAPVSPVREVVKANDTDKDKVTATETDEKDVTKETDKEDGTTESDKEATETNKNDLPEIPEGYTAGNLAALAKAYEQAGSPTAKAAIKRNMERSIAKWESKHPKVEAPKEEVKVEASATEDAVKVEKPAKEETKVKEEKPAKMKEKNPQAQLNAKHKAEREEMKAVQKAEREAFKAQRKAAKELEKQLKKEKKN